MLTPRAETRIVRLGLVTALALGVLVRVLPVLGSAMPMGDGGLFAAMIEDVRAAGLRIPPTTSFNGLDIPFLYPPGGIVLASGLGELVGASTLEILRWVPPVVAIGCLAAFIALARALLAPLAALGASLAYALMPHAFDWVIAGGGLTRGLGLLPALVAMWVVVRHGLTVPAAMAAGALLGISALAHPQTPIFGVVGVVVLATVHRPRLGTGLRWIVVTSLVALVVTAAWLIPATVEVGTLPILSAGHRWNPVTGLIRMASLEFSGAAFMDLFTPLALAGLATSVLRSRWRLPALVVLVYLASPGGGDFMGAVAWSLLAGAGLESVVTAAAAMGAVARSASAGFAVVALFLAMTSVLGAEVHEQSKLHALSVEQREAMEWVAREAPADTEFLVATVDTWGNDEVSEWFPAIARRTSVGTVQGSEWLGTRGFAEREDAHLDLVACIGDTAACYLEVAHRAGSPEAWLFVPKGKLAGPFSAADCCRALRATLSAAGYEIVYDGPGATVARPPD